MKVVIAVGGGGHFSPALAVIEAMPKDWEILLVGRKYAFEGDSALSLEYQTAKRMGLPFQAITTGRVQRKVTRHSFMSLGKMPVGFIQSSLLLKRFQPDVVLSFGGYVAVPVVLAAAMQRVPIVIHEQTLGAGLANKIAAKFATTVCISWQESGQYFPKSKLVLTGNPLRKAFVVGATREKEQEKKVLPLLYITGGSGGAHGINVLIEGCLEKLLEKYTVIHQTGDSRQFGDYERLEKVKAGLPVSLQQRYELQKFIKPEQVIHILSSADLIISRSGINTITELLYLRKPSLLIPLPYGQRNEQLENAKFMERLGLAEIVDQLQSTPDILFQRITGMVSTLHKYRRGKEFMQSLIHINAAENIIKEVEDAKEKRISA